jgi:hypothetical protein
MIRFVFVVWIPPCVHERDEVGIRFPTIRRRWNDGFFLSPQARAIAERGAQINKLIVGT